MPYTTRGKNAMLDAFGVTHVGALTDFPDDTIAQGSNEAAGGSYARQAISYAAAAAGSKAKAAGSVQIPIPASTTVFFLGGWDAATVGILKKWAPINGGAIKGVSTVANAGDVLTSYAHGLINTDRVIIIKANNEALPAGLSEAIIYFVVGATTDTFQLSLTSGGSAVVITTDGECAFQKVVGEVFASAGTLDVTADTSDLLG